MSTRARRAAIAAICSTAALAASCGGTPSPDLFVVTRVGTVPGAKLTLLVSDTSVRCNGGDPHPLSSEAIIDARVLHEDLLGLQDSKEAVPAPAKAQIFSFSVRSELGTLRYPDTAQRPTVLPRLTRFVRRAAIDLCGLKR